MDSVAVRIQNLDLKDQVLALARIAQGRSETGLFAPRHLELLFAEFALPIPAKVSNQLRALEKDGLVMSVRAPHGAPNRQLTPNGRRASMELASDMDLAALAAEGIHPLVRLGGTPHPVVPPSLAPPELIEPLRAFFEEHPFERNVFGMTRFPEKGKNDPITDGLQAAREVCEAHSLEFHLASDRDIHPDLWPNVAAHIWGSQYGISFFEDRTGKGLNYNLSIEVGSCLALGRQLAILKDKPVAKLPTDLTGKIWREVDLADSSTVTEMLHLWIRDTLNLGECPGCPKS